MRAILFSFFIATIVATQDARAAAHAGPPPILAPFGDGNWWVLAQSLHYTVAGHPTKIVVPRGFVTDLASVPSLFWSYLPKTGKYLSAAVLHDFLYWDNRCSQAEADAVFKLEMLEFGVESTKLSMIYNAVDTLGSGSYAAYTKPLNSKPIRIVPEKALAEFLRRDLNSKQDWAMWSTTIQAQYKAEALSEAVGALTANRSIRDVCKAALRIVERK